MFSCPSVCPVADAGMGSRGIIPPLFPLFVPSLLSHSCRKAVPLNPAIEVRGARKLPCGLGGARSPKGFFMHFESEKNRQNITVTFS